MARLRLAFMGTPDFAVPALLALHAAGHDIVAVYCQPPKPAGRGQQLQKTPVHVTAEKLALPVFTPSTLRAAEAQNALTALGPDVIVVAAYGLILPPAILAIPRMGCINIHASLLPRWRGAAPIQRAMLADDRETGITIMQMDAGLDSGAILYQEAVTITPTMTSQNLHDELAKLGAAMIVQTLTTPEKFVPQAQPTSGVTYAAKLTRADGAIDWTQPAANIARQIRALNPWPGTFCMLGDMIIKLLAAETTTGSGVPGTLLDQQCTIACGQGALRILQLQRPGKAPVSGVDFLRGARLATGQIFGNGA